MTFYLLSVKLFTKIAARRNLGAKTMEELRCASFFAGVGGIDLAFENAGFKTIYANEFDSNACKTYELNFNLKVDCRDINIVEASEIPDFDIMLAGFPCQAFSVAGYRQGFDDEKGRGGLFFELCRILKEKNPPVVFLENVKNLVGHDNGNTFRVILSKLNEMGYHIKYQVMNAMEYGNVPQNRERIYIVAFKSREAYQAFEFPQPIELKTKISDIINSVDRLDAGYYYTKKSCAFYDQLKDAVKDKNTVYQWRRVYVRENKSNVCPTLTANMGTGGHNVPIVLTPFGIRKLTPHECFEFQGYPKKYNLPVDLAQTHLYKQAGNSVVVPVIERIARNIVEAIKEIK